MYKPVVLIILDGWGLAPPGPGNAVSLAKLPNYHEFLAKYSHTELLASGEAVGLPHGEYGNTETGHLNLGAGYIVFQDLPRINMSIADGSFGKNPAFLAALNHVKKYSSNLHIMGLVGAGGVHSNIEHLLALLNLCEEEKFNNVYLHLFTDGRDSPPTSSQLYINQILDHLNHTRVGEIASISGRYYALDRDNRWERTEKVYKALTQGMGLSAHNALEAIDAAYKRGETDEFIKPTLILNNLNQKILIKENDSVIFFNYRVDRPRQLTKAFVLPDLKSATEIISFDPYAVKYYKKHLIPPPEKVEVFNRDPQIKNLFFVTMTEYEIGLPAVCAYPPEKIKYPLGKILSEAGKKQLHMAESEKERFVTYYFNGLREDPFTGEDDAIIPSPKVTTYDLKPEMSAWELTENLIMRIESQIYDFIVVNFANPDMVAHTGNINASIKALEVVDACLGQIVKKILEQKGVCLITADHGNVEELIKKDTNAIDTEHSKYPVPFIVIADGFFNKSIPRGVLADVAPTCLSLLNVPKSSHMSGRNLLEKIIN